MSKLKDLNGSLCRRRFEREVIVLCVGWYRHYKLSFRGLAEMMPEGGVPQAHTTIMRSAKHFTPEFVKRWNRLAMAAGQSWPVLDDLSVFAVVARMRSFSHAAAELNPIRCRAIRSSDWKIASATHYFDGPAAVLRPPSKGKRSR
ncbi:hypothetical protein [Paraburkholderia sp. BL6669N2]|uniref:hypothetical protein n=1 Tax=Paraburkholderia sp. BL6669N2 TaxID=1938807 RepID=UPI0015F28BB2|nr:hypothetical protein [Paraburkholderia sp. BL6669N2]